MIAQIDQIVVKDKGWLDQEEMIDCIAVSQSLPGIIAINCGTYVGRKTAGIAGAIAATLGVVTPSLVIIMAVASLLGTMGENAYLSGAFTGIKAAVCGLILVTVVKMARQAVHGVFQWMLVIGAFAAVAAFGITAVWPVIVGAAAGVLYQCIRKPDTESAKERRGGTGA